MNLGFRIEVELKIESYTPSQFHLLITQPEISAMG